MANRPAGTGLVTEASAVAKWRPNTAYNANDIVMGVGSLAGKIISAKVNFTSGAGIDPANWNVVTSTSVTTKGDLQVRSSTSDARLPIGTDGQQLVVDSTDDNGMQWAIPSANVEAYLRPTTAISETIPRRSTQGSIANGVILSGQLFLYAVVLPKNRTCTGIAWFSGGVTPAGLTNQWSGLFDANRVLLAVSADDTTNTWNAYAKKSFNFTTPYTTPNRGLYYVGIVVKADTTMPSFIGYGTPYSNTPFAEDPVICGNSNSGLTTPQATGWTASKPASTSNKCHPYGYVY